MPVNPAPLRPILKTSLPSAHASAQSETTETVTAAVKERQQEQGKSRIADGDEDALFQRFNKPGTDPGHLKVALHHARQIQVQKDTADLILDHILYLVELPSSSDADPAWPSSEDMQRFKSALVPFQPGDYDNLVLERNIEGRCGYALCPREHRKEDPNVKFRIKWGAKGSGSGGRGREMNIVPKEKLEMWCSEECAERAMYIRLQLAEEPVWERRGGSSNMEILLLEEAREWKMSQGQHQQRHSSRTTQPSERSQAKMREMLHQLNDLSVGRETEDDDEEMQAAMYSELAQERGDAYPALQSGRIKVGIVEKTGFGCDQVKLPAHRPEDAAGSIEGYVPKGFSRCADRDEGDLDMLGMLENLG